jgi:hypothetical protein
MGKDAILADRCSLSDALVGESGPLLPDAQAVKSTKVVDIFLRVGQLD